VTHTVVIEEDEETVQNFTVVGTPEFALSDYEWDFGDVTIGGSANKTFQIINAGGGELTITPSPIPAAEPLCSPSQTSPSPYVRIKP